MELEVRHLRLVQTVATLGSLTAAAGQLNLTQSALSHQLRDIEDRLGTPLFLRRSRRMIPTAAGQHLIETAGRVLADLARTEAQVRDIATERQGLLRVATECYTCYHWLPAVLRQFQKAAPGVDVRIEVDATTKPLAALLAGTLDLAVVTSPARDRRLASTALFRDEMLIVAPAGHRLASRPHARATDLAGETLFMYATPQESYVYNTLLQPAGVQPVWRQSSSPKRSSSSCAPASASASFRAGWSTLPAAARAQRRAIGPRGFLRGWSAVVPRGLARTDYVVEFLRLIGSCAPVRREHVTTKPILRPVRAAG